jgi:2-iminobutanoate/2-iminopropanoate deaminase
MNNIKTLSPDTLATPGGHYAHGVIANGFLFVSGQLPITAAGEKLNDAPFAQQVNQVLANVSAVLVHAGATTDALVSVRVYVTDIALWPEFNRLYADWIGTHRPARAVVPVPMLHYGFKIEVEAVALLKV